MPASMTTFRLFCPCPRGLEALLAEELRALGASETRPVPGGVAWQGDMTAWLRANLESRLASRVLVEVAQGHGAGATELYRLLRQVRWRDWLTPDQTLRVDVLAQGETPDAVPFLVLRCKDAICDAMRADFGRRPSVDKTDPDVRVVVFWQAGWVRVYWDSSGAPLYQRGFKVAKVAAPIKEHLAAGILRLIGWTPQGPLLDPMCGSGTFLLEAALIAANWPPGGARAFAFERWSGLDRPLWQRLQQQARKRADPARLPPLFGRDRDAAALAAAQRNVAALPFEVPVTWEVVAAEDSVPPLPTGFWVANPPYGVRLEEQTALCEWYPRLGDALKRRWAGWTAHILTADPEFPKHLGLRPQGKWTLYQGALAAKLLRYPLRAGPWREHAATAAG